MRSSAVSSRSSMTSDSDIVASEALMKLISPDGYYSYLGIPKGQEGKVIINSDDSTRSETDELTGSGSGIDEDLVKKNYRKLSLKHHPDKPGGDAETFRVLNRAQKVLLNPKLRQQYDILGIDLDDDEVHTDEGGDQQAGKSESDHPSTAQGIVQEIASQVLAGLIQLGVRTVMMAAVSVILVRYKWTLYPALAFLAYVAYSIIQGSRRNGSVSVYDVMSPLLIATGLVLMYRGQLQPGESSVTSSGAFIFWLGESTVIGIFTYNSLPGIPKQLVWYGVIGAFAMIAALWFRGKVWNYGVVIFFEALLALLVAFAFPLMEMILEAILNEKLRKVGDKVRAHHALLEKHYERARLRGKA